MKPWKSNINQLNSKHKKNRLIERDAYNRSKLKEIHGYIFRQDDERIKDLKYGVFFKVGQNGCGVVAAYNVMLELGKPVDFCDVLLEFELNNLGRVSGLLGTSPHRLPRYFKAHGVECEVINDFKEYKRRANEFKISIIFIREKKSLVQHYFCVLKRVENDFITINQYYSNTFGNLKWDNHFIKAYCFKK